MIIHHSARESEIMQLKIGRASLQELNAGEIINELVRGEYDLLKITIPTEIPDLYIRLEELGIPYFIVGIINHYRYDCVHHKVTEYYHENLIFEPFDSETQKEQLRQFARDIFRESPGSYFDNPHLKNLVTREMYLQSFEEYVLSFDQKTDPHKLTYFVKHEGRYVGFLSLTNKDRESDAAYAGVIPDRRGTGYYLDMIRFIHNWGHEVGLKWGHGYVQLQNTVVQRFYHRTDMMIFDHHFSIHINSFLSRGKENQKTFEFSVASKEGIADHVLRIAGDECKGYHLKNLSVCSIKNPVGEERYTMRLTKPVTEEKKILAVAKIYSAAQELLEVHYCEMIKF